MLSRCTRLVALPPSPPAASSATTSASAPSAAWATWRRRAGCSTPCRSATSSPGTRSSRRSGAGGATCPPRAASSTPCPPATSSPGTRSSPDASRTGSWTLPPPTSRAPRGATCPHGTPCSRASSGSAVWKTPRGCSAKCPRGTWCRTPPWWTGSRGTERWRGRVRCLTQCRRGTFLSVLSACGHVGRVDVSLKLFDLMSSKYAISPRAEHYACIVDIVSRAGQLEKACNYIKEMPFEAEKNVWGALLGACQTRGNVQLGELAAKMLVQSDSESSGPYVMLSNIYAANGMWNEVNQVRGRMKEKGVKKQPGYSWTEIANEVHMFVGGDASHPEMSKIISELRKISIHMQVVTDETHIAAELAQEYGWYFSFPPNSDAL